MSSGRAGGDSGDDSIEVMLSITDLQRNESIARSKALTPLVMLLELQRHLYDEKQYVGFTCRGYTIIIAHSAIAAPSTPTSTYHSPVEDQATDAVRDRGSVIDRFTRRTRRDRGQQAGQSTEKADGETREHLHSTCHTHVSLTSIGTQK